MLGASIGLSLEDGRLTVVALGGRDRLSHFVVEGVEDPARALDAELRARKLPAATHSRRPGSAISGGEGARAAPSEQR